MLSDNGPPADPEEPPPDAEADPSPADDLVPIPELDIDADEAADAGDEPDLPPELIARAVRRVLAWRAPLPPPDMLQEYERVDPGLTRKIVDHFEQRSALDAEALRSEIRSDDRELTLMEREQRLRERESEADIRTRWFGHGFGAFFLVLLAILAFVVLMWGPLDGDWAKVVAAAAFMAPITVLGLVVLIRGRMTAQERDVYRDVLPHLRARQSDAPPLKPGDESGSEP